MKTATVTQAKNGLSALLDQVRAGETILITDRGMPVARLEPAGSTTGAGDRMRRLERAGLVRIGKGRAPVDVIRSPGPVLPPGASAVEALLEERRSGW
jgi:prevent-host-death family protein